VWLSRSRKANWVERFVTHRKDDHYADAENVVPRRNERRRGPSGSDIDVAVPALLSHIVRSVMPSLPKPAEEASS
jgi:hypothetical protein